MVGRLSLPPIPDALTSAEVTYYRHDQSTSPLARYLPAEARTAIEDARGPVRQGRSQGPAPRGQRVHAPHLRGDPSRHALLGTPGLQGANSIDMGLPHPGHGFLEGCEAHLGGGRGKGHGTCDVQMVSAIRLAAGVGPVPVNVEAALPAVTVDVSAGEVVAAEYAAHVTSVREEALKVIGSAS